MASKPDQVDQPSMDNASNYNEDPRSSASSKKPNQKAKEEMMVECEITWRHIQDIHHRLASYKENNPPAGADKSNAMLKLLQHKEKRLQATLDIIKNQDVEVTSKDLQFVEMLHLDEMKKSNAQLRDMLKIVKVQRIEVASDTARERKLLEEQLAIQRNLKEKLQALQQQDDEQPQNSVIAELQEKKKLYDKYYLTVMNKLGKFLSDHFPIPGNDDGHSSKEEDARLGKQYCSLQHIIETLMNRLFESPHDCYVEILPTYWRPYIELLLRVNIIQRHPDNCYLIRLIAFHA